MTEPLPERTAPPVAVDPVEPDDDLAHRNNVFGLALFGLFILLFGGTFLIAFVYLAVT